MSSHIVRAFVVSHTHWDREWYRTRHEFFISLVDVIRRALDRIESEDRFRHFLLDGQAIILEDYLDAYPEDGERIRGHIESGALAVGPWYVLSDEFLVSGESTIRNLLIGRRVARGFGGVQNVGYMPDSFGHIAQLPQILRRAGLDSFIYTRGNGASIDETGCEYWWQSPDGSRVLATHQPGGYINGGFLGHEQPEHAGTRRPIDIELAVSRVTKLLAEIGNASSTGVALINNGYDHLPPQEKLGEIIDAVQVRHPDLDIRHGSLAEYVEAVRGHVDADNSFAGELRYGRDHFALSGVWSTRAYLKQANEACETLLSATLEPLLSYGRFMLAGNYPERELHSLWKRLLENHPHDSICGCSVDPVHREMMTRFAGIRDSAGELLRTMFQSLTPTYASDPASERAIVMTLFNPLPQSRSEVVERVLVLPPDQEPWTLTDEHGNQVPFLIRERRRLRHVWGTNFERLSTFEEQARALLPYVEGFPETQGAPARDYVSIQLVADVPGISHRNYFIGSASGDQPTSTGSVLATANTLENDHLSVTLHANGCFDLRDRESGDVHLGLNLLADTADVGDSYDTCGLTLDDAITSEGCRGRVQCLHASALAGTLECRFELPLPTAANRARDGREEHHVPCPVCVTVTLRHGCRHVEVELCFENHVRDHRLRVQFPTRIETEHVGSDSQFLLIERPVQETGGDDWTQSPLPTRPQQEFSWLRDGERGLAVFNRGLPEVEAIPTDRGTTLSVTLLRCVEWLSRHDVVTRGQANAGPTFHVPEAQCPGTHTFRYGVLPFRGDPVGADLKSISRRYRSPVLATQGVADGHVPETSGLLECRSKHISVTAVKKHEIRDTLVVRLYSLAGETVQESLQLGRPVTGAWRTDLHEERTRELSVDGDAVPISLNPHEIATIEIEFMKGPPNESLAGVRRP